MMMKLRRWINKLFPKDTIKVNEYVRLKKLPPSVDGYGYTLPLEVGMIGHVRGTGWTTNRDQIYSVMFGCGEIWLADEHVELAKDTTLRIGDIASIVMILKRTKGCS